MTDDVRSYSLKYPDRPAAFWLDLCPLHLATRLIKASVMDKRKPVTVSVCADCKPRETLR